LITESEILYETVIKDDYSFGCGALQASMIYLIKLIRQIWKLCL